jgi:hypothetical protein
MSTGRFVLCGMLGMLAAFWTASCQGPQEFFRDNAISSGTGGVVSTGGQGESTGGAPGTGGAVVGSGGSGTGGLTATGGSPGSGGKGGSGTGGLTGTGGVRATGGVTGTGGIVATGGVTGTGGIVATGGVTGTGGIAATGGVTGTGGVTATGGTTGAAGSTGTAKNCADAIKLAGYSAGTAPPCSACKENGADKSMSCMKVIDCLDTNYPCGSNMNCALNCNNSGGADSVVSVCVNALLTAGSCVQP